MVAICNASAAHITLQNERQENVIRRTTRKGEGERPGRERALPAVTAHRRPAVVFHRAGASPRNFSSLFSTHFHVVLDYFRKRFSAATNLLLAAAVPVAVSLARLCMCVGLLRVSAEALYGVRNTLKWKQNTNKSLKFPTLGYC